MSKHRLIVGVDYGTTYSGVSFVTTAGKSIDDVTVIRSWPGKDGEWKAPTRIAYSHENPTAELGHRNVWGYEVEPWMTSCSWTKLLLDTSRHQPPLNGYRANTTLDHGMHHLPAGKTAPDVCEDYLRELFQLLVDIVSRKMKKQVLDTMSIDCWITVPALWSDHARSATRSAALAAGFGARHNDSISVISEPEAAAISVLKKYMQPGAFNAPKPGETVMICDCGGGTVDITTYTIQQTSPTLVFGEPVVGTGDKCGATFIDRNLHDLMREWFGEAWDRVDIRLKGPGSTFMERWEAVKRSFGMPDQDRTKRIGPLILRGLVDSPHYDEAEGLVLLKPNDVERLFEPVVRKVIKLVSDQAREVHRSNKSLNRLILVGGFGDSAYLYSRLEQWAADNGSVQVECAEHPQAAVVRGAALRGLEGTAPETRMCRKNYGFVQGSIFREGIDPEDKHYFDAWDGRKRCMGRVDWIIRKGEAMTKETHRGRELYIACTRKDEARCRTRLVSCSLDNPPDWADDPRVENVGVILADFSQANKHSFESQREYGFVGKKIRKFDFTLQVCFGGQSGLLEFKTLIRGALSGTASIAFD